MASGAQVAPSVNESLVSTAGSTLEAELASSTRTCPLESMTSAGRSTLRSAMAKHAAASAAWASEDWNAATTEANGTKLMDWLSRWLRFDDDDATRTGDQ